LVTRFLETDLRNPVRVTEHVILYQSPVDLGVGCKIRSNLIANITFSRSNTLTSEAGLID
jgi:hypothetical protein